MKYTRDKIIGIVGGMGPQAGNALFERIINNTAAAADQEHLSVVLMSFPSHIVDRTAFITGQTAVNPATGIVQVIKKLEKTGAEIIGIACNTSYSPEIYDSILYDLRTSGSSIKLVNMPVETCMHIRKNHPAVDRVGVMTTNGAWASGVYTGLLEKMGYKVIVPDRQFQDEVVHRIIYDPQAGLKANPRGATATAKRLLKKALQYFKAQDAQAIILGCTELSLVLDEKTIQGMEIIDSNSCLARALIRESGAVALPKHTLCGNELIG